MRPTVALVFALFVLAACEGCSSTQPTANGSDSSATQNAATQNRTQTVQVPPIAAAHGGATNVPAGTSSSVASPISATPSDKPSLATPELDAKIAKAEGKGGDRKAAAAAYIERGNVYYSAGQPMLYKFALGDFRRALRYDPTNAEAKAKMDQIIDIYVNSLHRPVPTNGLNDQ